MKRNQIVCMAVMTLAGCVPAQGPQVAVTPQVQTVRPVPEAPKPFSATEIVYFDADSTIITEQTHDTLRLVSTLVRMNKELVVTLVGRTDQSGNASMALRRAIAIRNGLSQMGVAPERISVQDEAQSDHILSRQSPEKGDKTEDRRVDILITSKSMDQAI